MKTRSTTLIAAVAVLTINSLQLVKAQSWAIGGNTVTKDTTLGTKNSFALRFITNNALRMTLSSNGDFGVGTFAPTARLEVWRGSGVSNIARFTNAATSGDRSSLIEMKNGNGFLWRYGVGGTGNNRGLTKGQFYIEKYSGTPYLVIDTIGNIYFSNRLYVKGALTMHAPGAENFFIGPNAGNTAITGYGGNTATGSNALHSLTSGSTNTANGFYALYSDTSGGSNTAIGDHALVNNTIGNVNTAIGVYAQIGNTTGSFNTAIGDQTLYNNTIGNGNTALGHFAGRFITNGSYNTFIGCGTYGTPGDITNATALGNAATVDASNTIRIGNSAVTSIGGYVGWSNVSDGRIKKNIKNDVPGLAFVNKLNPITYNLDLDAADKINQRKDFKANDSKIINPTQQEIAARKAKEQIIYTGFVAQEVEKAAKELNYDFSGVDAAKNDKDLYGLRYAEFVVPLVKAVQELSKLNNEKDEKITDLNTKITDLQQQINELKGIKTTGTPGTAAQQSAPKVILGNPSLDQNNPNPFTSTTAIRYNLPASFKSAQIIITDNGGKTIKQVQLNTAGTGTLNIDTPTLTSGTYTYSLVVDGKLIESKKMIVTH